MKKLTGAIALLCLALLPSSAHAQATSKDDGRLLEQTPFALPAFDELPDRFKRAYPRDVVERMHDSRDLELLKIKYLSDGLRVSGFIYKPKDVAGRKVPVVIWNRGGVGEGTIISVENFLDFYEMHRYASEGFVVLAPQYRGYDGGERKDEVGGADLDEVKKLL